MFKKTLAGLAVAGLFSGAAMAADVQLYGVVDQGFMYNHTKVDQLGGSSVKDDSFSMESGMNASSRFGLKGSEDLGNGLQVAFVLENSFAADSGELTQGGRLFGRQASLTLKGGFGEFSFGRMGGVASSAGTYDLVYANGDAFDGFDNSIGGLVMSSRYDNMITYQTPNFGGLTVTAQHSFKQDSVAEGTKDDKEGSSDADRYSSLAVNGQWGALALVAAYEQQNFQHVGAGKTQPDDQHTFYVGGNYDFGVTKVFGMAQRFTGARNLNGWEIEVDGADKTQASDGIDGYGLTVGAVTPLAGGTLTTSVYYVDADAKGSFSNETYLGKDMKTGEADADYQYLGLAARYEYSLSKRTTVYGGAGYAQEEVKADGEKLTGDLYQAYVGLKHTF